MNELERALIADSFATPPAYILEGVENALAQRATPGGAPHPIYAELWHIVYW